MTSKKKISQEEFDRRLEEKARKLSGAELLALPGVYEILSEEFNNEIIVDFENDNAEDDPYMG